MRSPSQDPPQEASKTADSKKELELATAVSPPGPLIELQNIRGQAGLNEGLNTFLSALDIYDKTQSLGKYHKFATGAMSTLSFFGTKNKDGFCADTIEDLCSNYGVTDLTELTPVQLREILQKNSDQAISPQKAGSILRQIMALGRDHSLLGLTISGLVMGAQRFHPETKGGVPIEHKRHLRLALLLRITISIIVEGDPRNENDAFSNILNNCIKLQESSQFIDFSKCKASVDNYLAKRDTH
ncbi:MAG: hypothetical protein VW378_04275 [bacterium]